MTELTELERRRRRRAGCGWGCGGVLGLLLLLVAGVAAYWGYANQIPNFTPAAVNLPNPNACDECLAAIALQPPESGPVLTDLQEGKEVDLKGIVQAAQPALAKVRSSFRHPYMNPTPTSYTTEFRELGPLRNIARLFTLEGRLAEEEGRYEDAARSYLDCYRLGSEMQRGGVLIHGLVGNAIQAIALAPLDELSEKLDEKTAVSAARELAQLEAATPGPVECLEAESQFGEMSAVELMRQSRGSYYTLMQVLYGGSGGGPPPDWNTFQVAVRYSLTPKKQMLDSHRRYLLAHVEEARKPYGQRSPLPPAPDDPLNQVALPVLDGATFAWDRSRGNSRLVQGKLAARAFFLRHGRMPKSMQEVAPEIVPKAPVDWFSGKPLLIGPLMGSGPPKVYSVGPDKDDDNGRALGRSINENSDGDLVEIRRRSTAKPAKQRPIGPPAMLLGPSKPPTGPPPTSGIAPR